MFESLLPLWLLKKLAGKKIIFPFYHSVSDDELLHLKNIYQYKNPRQFESDLDYLLSGYQPISAEGLMQHVSEEKKISVDSFLLSFDDGLKECYEIIAPILKRKGIPAVFFLNTGCIDNRNLFFRHKASLLAEEIRQRNVPLLEKKVIDFCRKHFHGAHSGNAVKAVLSVDYKRQYVLDALSEICNLSFSEFLKKQRPYLTSAAIQELLKDGFAIGSHSIDHPPYDEISYEEKIKQTRESLEFLANRFNITYKLFAFPFHDFSLPKSFFEKLYEKKIADITFGTSGMKNDSWQNHFHRIAMEKDALTGNSLLKREYVKYFFRTLVGINTVSRS